MLKTARPLAMAFGLLCAPAGAAAQDERAGTPPVETPAGADDTLLDMSLEDILSQEVTSVAKKAQRAVDAPAAVYVISQEQISRSGANTITDLLRRVPGLEVFEVQGSATSVSARGFSSRYAANLLVMIDGAAIYSTSVSGMFWDQAIMPLQDIERIEVIRGPGGPLWGSNSINGIINIISKQSVDTQGLRADGKAGLRDVRAELGYSWQIAPTLGVRTYGSYGYSKGLQYADGSNIVDHWNGLLGGVRFDYAPDDDDNLVALGELSRGDFAEVRKQLEITPSGPVSTAVEPHEPFHSEHVLVRWRHVFSPDVELTSQVYYNYLARNALGADIGRALFDASFDGHWHASPAHDFNFGMSGRISRDTVIPTDLLSLAGGRRTERWITGYAQDEIALQADRLSLTLGSKFEVNSFNGFNAQPSARLFYRPDEGLAFWAAASRAVRTPLLLQRAMTASFFILTVPPGQSEPIPTLSTVVGNAKIGNETLLALEAGVRAELNKWWSLDLSAYHNRYDHLTTVDMASIAPLIIDPYPFPVGIATVSNFRNNGYGHSWGAELVLSGRLTKRWNVELSYSYLDLHLAFRPNPGLLSIQLVPADASSRHQVRLSSSVDLGDKLSLDGFVHYLSKSYRGARPAFTDLDLRLAYHPRANLELAVAGRHLLQSRHLEYFEDFVPIPTGYVPRAVTVEARVRF